MKLRPFPVLVASIVSVASMAVVGCSNSSSQTSGAAGGKVPVAQAMDPKAAAQIEVITVGTPTQTAAAPIPVSAVLASPEMYAGGPIQIQGNVSAVCAKKGCWARLTDASTPAGKDLFVKFECPADESGRILPLSAQGKPAIVEGTVLVTEISEAKARHYAIDAGQSEAEAAKIVGPQKQVTVSAPAIRVYVPKQATAN